MYRRNADGSISVGILGTDPKESTTEPVEQTGPVENEVKEPEQKRRPGRPKKS